MDNTVWPFENTPPDMPAVEREPDFWEHIAELLEQIEYNTRTGVQAVREGNRSQGRAVRVEEAPAVPSSAIPGQSRTQQSRQEHTATSRGNRRKSASNLAAVQPALLSSSAVSRGAARPIPASTVATPVPSQEATEEDARITRSVATRAARETQAQAGGLLETLKARIPEALSTAVGAIDKKNAIDLIGYGLGGPIWGAFKDVGSLVGNIAPGLMEGLGGPSFMGNGRKARKDGRDEHGRFIAGSRAPQTRETEIAEDSLALAQREARKEKKRHEELVRAVRQSARQPGKGLFGREKGRRASGQRQAPEGGIGSGRSRRTVRARSAGASDNSRASAYQLREVAVGSSQGGLLSKRKNRPGRPARRSRARGKFGGLLAGVGALLGAASFFGDDGVAAEDIALDAGLSLASTPKAAGMGGKAVKAVAAKPAGLLGKFGKGLGATGKGIGKALGGVGKVAGLGAKGALGVARALPGLGQILTVGMAAMDGYQGWNDTEMHKQAFALEDGQEASTGQKASAAAANILDMGGLFTGAANMFGFDISTADIASGIYNAGSMIFKPYTVALDGISKVGEGITSLASSAWDGLGSLFGARKDKGEEKESLFAMAEALEHTAGAFNPALLGGMLEGLNSPLEMLTDALGSLTGAVDKNTKATDKNDLPFDSVFSEIFSTVDTVTRSFGGGGASATPVSQEAMAQAQSLIDGDLGSLSAHYESGRRGSAAVGWDRTGGTSYGKYQIASRTGTMNSFLAYAKEKNPEVYERLKAAGPADAGKNGRFAQEWQSIVAEGKMGSLEHDFIKATHFDPAFAGIKSEGLRGRIEGSKTLQDVLWSTSVQHGSAGASRLVNRVYKEGMSDEDFIAALYAARGTQFGSSDAATRNSVQNRFVDEQGKALAMLKKEKNDPADITLASGETSTKGAIVATQTTPAIIAATPSENRVVEQRAPHFPNPVEIPATPQKDQDTISQKQMLALLAQLVELTRKQTEKMSENNGKAGSQTIAMDFDDPFSASLAHDQG